MESVFSALGLTLAAGLATGIGSMIAFMVKRTNYRFLAVSTAFSAGVMLYVSFVEIFVKGIDSFAHNHGEYWAHWMNAASFFGGILFIGLIDNLIPAAENPHETHSAEEMAPLHDTEAPLPDFADGRRIDGDGQSAGVHDHEVSRGRMMRTGLFMALVIGIHNLPEGLATFLGAIQDPSIGFAIAVAVALHNIPEGISISVPIFYATGNRKKAFVYSFLSGLAEPVGAAAAYLLLFLFADGDTGKISQITGIMFGAVAGIMVYVSIDELLPTSRAYGKGHDSLIGLVSGMGVMALSLLLLK